MVWVDVTVGIVLSVAASVPSTDLEQFSLLRMLAFKNVTNTLRLAVRGA